MNRYRERPDALNLGTSTSWAASTLCAQADPDAWFPEKGESTREAKRICLRCPVRAECLEDTLSRGERYGVWGGLSERQRRQLLRPRGAGVEHIDVDQGVELAGAAAADGEGGVAA